MFHQEQEKEILNLSQNNLFQKTNLNEKEENLSEKEKSDKKLQTLQFYCLLLYFILIISSICLFSFNKSLNKNLMDFFLHIDENMNFDQFLLLAFSIIFLVIIGFPTMPWELALGYFFKSYILAYSLDVCCKVCGFVLIFFISKVFLKKKIDDLLKCNKYFNIIKLGINTHPYKTVFLIKIMMIPHLIKNYGLGLTDLSFIQYFLPSFIVAMMFGAIWIYFGRQLSGISNIFDSDESHIQINIVKILLLMVTLMSIAIILCYGKKLYRDLEKEVEKENLKNYEEVKDYGACLRN